MTGVSQRGSPCWREFPGYIKRTASPKPTGDRERPLFWIEVNSPHKFWLVVCHPAAKLPWWVVRGNIFVDQLRGAERGYGGWRT
jgi:hypothetical protein